MAMEKVRYQPVVMVSFKLFFIAAGTPLAYVKWICKSFSTPVASSKASCSLMEGRHIHPAEGENHPQNQPSQRQQPGKCKAEVLQVEKDDAPEKVECQLRAKELQTPHPGIGWRGQADARCAEAHQKE